MSMKKALCVASMASNLDNFNRNNVKILKALGYDVTLAANFHTFEDSSSQEKIDSFVKEMESDGVHTAQIDFSRKIWNVSDQVKSYRQVKQLLLQEFELIHCHSPICAAITRICAKKYRKNGTRVVYTVHGFHFYDGAPLKNWIFFYPIEKWLSRYTDVLITINKEDYKRASEKFKAKKTVYVPGVGVDTEKYGKRHNRNKVRAELGLNETDMMLLSVGELNKNKNHEVVIKALGKMKAANLLPENIYYYIAGIGPKETDLKGLIIKYGLKDKVKFLGYCSEIADVYAAADIFVFPSYREGLSVSLMEAMASGLPVVCSKIRGNTDLVDEHGGCFFDPSLVESVVDSITYIINSKKVYYGASNIKKMKDFSIGCIKKKMEEIY